MSGKKMITRQQYLRLSQKRSERKLALAFYVVLFTLLMFMAVTYAWMKMPHEKNNGSMGNSVSGSGSLELALMPVSGKPDGIGNETNSSGSFSGGGLTASDANTGWGNLVDLSDPLYGLSDISLRPCIMNEENCTVEFTPCVSPAKTEDGGGDDKSALQLCSHYASGTMKELKNFSGSGYGVRALTDTEGNTYGYAIDLAFRAGENGNLLLKTGDVRDLSGDSGSGETIKSESSFSFFRDGESEGSDPEDVPGFEDIEKYMDMIRVSFVLNYGNSDGGEQVLLAEARPVYPSGGLYLCDESGNLMDEAGMISLDENEIYQVSVVIWLEGAPGAGEDTEDMVIDGEMLANALLDLRFSTDVMLIPALDSYAEGQTEQEYVYLTEAVEIIKDEVYGFGSYKQDLFSDAHAVAWRVKEKNGSVYVIESEKDLEIFAFSEDIAADVSVIKEDFLNTAFTEEDKKLIKEINIDYSGDSQVTVRPVVTVDLSPVRGVCGESVYWSLNRNTGLMTIFGKGKMQNNPRYPKSGIVTVDIRSGVTGIGDNAFAHCKNLERISISHTVETIGQRAFFGCIKLESAAIPVRMLSIGAEAFRGCESITGIKLPAGIVNISDKLFYGCGSLRSVTISDRAVSIGSYSFFGCGQLTSLDLPENVSDIGDHAFASSGITRFDLPESMKLLPNGLFMNCKGLVEVTVPDGVTEIGYGVFSGCELIEKIKLPESVASIKGGAFAYCASLCEINIPSGVRSIGALTFANCIDLKKINIPAGIEKIEEFTFQGCSGLEKIVVPESVTAISNNAFSYCSSLEDIILPDTVKEMGYGVFSGCGNLKKIKLPSECGAIPESAFSGCEALSDISIPDAATEIGTGAFAYCGSLKTASIPGSVKKIGSYAFRDCTSLKTVKISSGVSGVDQNAFSGCDSLASVEFGGTCAEWRSNLGISINCPVRCSDGNVN